MAVRSLLRLTDSPPYGECGEFRLRRRQQDSHELAYATARARTTGFDAVQNTDCQMKAGIIAEDTVSFVAGSTSQKWISESNQF
ncbi:MAG: hypothetical protein NT010_09425 [Proteobacteria bacterium]|nr:hypothetical protein [Pseudomonadota bacterium]